MRSIMVTLLTALIALAAMVCQAAPIPKYATRQRTHPAAAAGLRMINGDVKPNSYLVSDSVFY